METYLVCAPVALGLFYGISCDCTLQNVFSIILHTDKNLFHKSCAVVISDGRAGARTLANRQRQHILPPGYRYGTPLTLLVTSANF